MLFRITKALRPMNWFCEKQRSLRITTELLAHPWKFEYFIWSHGHKETGQDNQKTLKIPNALRNLMALMET